MGVTGAITYYGYAHKFPLIFYIATLSAHPSSIANSESTTATAGREVRE